MDVSRESMTWLGFLARLRDSETFLGLGRHHSGFVKDIREESSRSMKTAGIENGRTGAANFYRSGELGERSRGLGMPNGLFERNYKVQKFSFGTT